jgi:hypothetical protein
MVKIKMVTVKEDANSITKGIVNLLRSEGHSARRINTVGIWDEKNKCFRKGVEAGTADIIGCLAPDGKMIAIEVKFKKDTQRAAQKEYQAEVESAGGIYLIIKTYVEFLVWYRSFTYL